MAKKPTWQDSVYQKQLSYYKKLAADFAAQQARRKAELGTYFGTLGTPDQKTTKNVRKFAGYDYDIKKRRVIPGDKTWPTKYRWMDYRVKSPTYRNTKVTTTKKGKKPTEGLYQRELTEQRFKDLSDIASDYASRGLLRSGVYAKKRGNYETEFGKQLSEINRQRSKQYADLASEALAFAREQELQKENARLEAIRRRAARTGDIGF